MMAAKIAVKLRVFLLMTGDAEIHLKIHLAKPVHRLDVPVAVHAVEFGAYVWNMPEFHEIRNKENAHPGDRDFFIKMLLFLYNLRVHRNYVFMAKETLLDFRQSRVLPTLDEWMAEAAVDLFYTGVYPVAEKDRLDRSHLLLREKIKQV
jgi:hypothetical protein